MEYFFKLLRKFLNCINRISIFYHIQEYMILEFGFLLFFVILFFIIYELSKDDIKEKMTTKRSDLPLFNMQKTKCFGNCPVYDAAIYPDGTVAYNGDENVNRIGYYEFKLTKNELNSIKKDIADLDVMNLSNDYDGNITDVPSTILMFFQNGSTKKIKARYNIPPKLQSFINKMHKLINKKNEI